MLNEAADEMIWYGVGLAQRTLKPLSTSSEENAAPGGAAKVSHPSLIVRLTESVPVAIAAWLVPAAPRMQPPATAELSSARAIGLMNSQPSLRPADQITRARWTPRPGMLR